MRTIVHLSDLHFGRVDDELIDPLLEAAERAEPDLIAISGDFTQNGTEREFAMAAAFLRRLRTPWLAVPGNHDMAFLNPWRRATQRLRLFREYVTNEPEPFWSDDEIAAMGLNSARVTHLRDGRIREWQVRKLEERMGTVPPDVVRILVTHHPFDLPEIFPASEIVGRGARYIRRVVQCIDIMLAGHMHISHAAPTAMRYNVGGDSAIFVQAGTALSTRVRSEENAFQVLRIAADAVEVRQFRAGAGGFAPGASRVFRQSQGVWALAGNER